MDNSIITSGFLTGFYGWSDALQYLLCCTCIGAGIGQLIQLARGIY